VPEQPTKTAEKPAPDRESKRATWSTACLRIAAIAGFFTLVLGGLLIFNSTRLYTSDDGKVRLVEANELLPLKSILRHDPKNEEIKQRIRDLDKQLREDYFRREQLASRGGWLLIAGAIVFVVTLQLGLHLRRPRLPVPNFPTMPPDPKKTASISGRAVTGTTLALAGLTFSLVIGVTTRWDTVAAETSPNQKSPISTQQSGSADPDWFPTPEEFAANWYRFRGPGGLATATIPDLPQSWNGETGENILWKSKVPLPGENSLLVWGDHVYLTGATEKKREIYCLDTKDGKLLWTTGISTPQGSRAEPPEILDETGFAASTAVTDGRRVVAMFANGDIGGVAADGKLLWTRHLGVPDNIYGHATSLTMWRNRVIVVYDQGDGEKPLSKLLALDAATGKNIWSTPRPVPNSWVSPIIIEVDGKPQIITAADPWVIAYNPEDGAEIWRVKLLSGDVAPSPAFANGLVYVANDGACAAAIRPDGTGDVTETHVAWQWDEGDLPDMCSLIADSERFYLLVFGRLHAFDAKTGKYLWEHDFETELQASPSLINGQFWFLTDEGETIIGDATNEGFKESARHPIGEHCGASHSFAPGRVYIRSREHIFCIGNKDD